MPDKMSSNVDIVDTLFVEFKTQLKHTIFQGKKGLRALLKSIF